jgi:hypothetical protein
MRRSKPPVYRGKSVVKRMPTGGTLQWKKQKLLTVLHFRHQPEEEVALVQIDNNAYNTYVYELLMEDGAFILTEDGATLYSNDA